jgi:hypothetical protein
VAKNLHFGKFSCLVSAPAFDLTNTDEARNAKKGEKAA